MESKFSNDSVIGEFWLHVKINRRLDYWLISNTLHDLVNNRYNSIY